MSANRWAGQRKLFLCCALAGLFPTVTLAQQGKVLLTQAQCMEDIATAFEIMESVHPDLYSLRSQDEMTRRRSALEQSLPDRISAKEFFCRLAPLIAHLRDGHTLLPLPTAASLGEESRPLLPLEIEIREDCIHVTADYSDKERLLIGKELLHINGRSVQDLLDEMMAYQNQEVLAARQTRIAEFFRAYLWLVCDVESPFKLSYRSAGENNIETVTLVGQTLATISTSKQDRPSNNRPLYTYRFDAPSRVGILEYNACVNDGRFRGFLRETFTQVQRDQPVAFVVDARKNGGGSARANVALFHYLTDKPYRMYSVGEVKISRFIKEKVGREAFEERFGSWDSPNNTTQSHSFPMREASENALRYSGPLIVLAGPSTLSSGMNFVNAVKDCDLGIIVGEETGNPATAFGDLEAFLLPNSQLSLYVSTKYFVRPNGLTDRRGVLPDREVRQTDTDSRAGRDTVMEFAKQLAQREVRGGR